MSTNFVYPNIKSRWGQELKFSLRSLEQNFVGDYNVYIIGHLPEYLNPKAVTRIKYDDLMTPGRKTGTLNYHTKLSIAVGLFDDFVYMNDDIFLVQHPQDAETLKKKVRNFTFNEGGAPRWIGSEKTQNIWRRFLMNTYNRLTEAGYKNVYNCDLHIPQYIDSEKIQKVLELFKDIPGRYLFHSAYVSMNYKPEEVPICDFKTRYLIGGPRGELDPRIKIVNINEPAIRKQRTKDWLDKMFPNKSKFER